MRIIKGDAASSLSFLLGVYHGELSKNYPDGFNEAIPKLVNELTIEITDEEWDEILKGYERRFQQVSIITMPYSRYIEQYPFSQWLNDLIELKRAGK